MTLRLAELTATEPARWRYAEIDERRSAAERAVAGLDRDPENATPREHGRVAWGPPPERREHPDVEHERRIAARAVLVKPAAQLCHQAIRRSAAKATTPWWPGTLMSARPD